jgi:hypothetical protein
MRGGELSGGGFRHFTLIKHVPSEDGVFVIFAHMIVGPGEADRYLTQVLGRLHSWADAVFVALDREAGEAELEITQAYADGWGFTKQTWEDHEGRFRQEAWEMMVNGMNPSPQDHIMLIDADEVIHEYDMVKEGVRNYPNMRLGFQFHEMWGPTQYRIDGHWKPYNAWVLIPFQHGGRFKDRALACGREPTYAFRVPMMGTPIAKLLHYGYARPRDRRAKYDRYQRLDGGKYHSPSHLESILHTPSLETWTKGGLLDV